MFERVPKIAAERLWVFFVLVFGVGFFSQMILWSHFDFADSNLWTQRVEFLAYDIEYNLSEISQINYSGHPGMAALTLAALFNILGVPAGTSLSLGVSILIAAASAGAAVVTFLLRPKIYLWLPVMSIMLGHSLYTEVTPTNAVIAPLITLIFLMGWWRVEAGRRSGYRFLFVYGLVIGAALATRMAVAIFVGFFALLVLYKVLKTKQLLLLLVMIFLFLLLFDPLMLFAPVEHISYMTGRVQLHAVGMGETAFHAPSFMVSTAPSIVSILLLIALWIVSNRIKFPVPKRIAVYLLGVTFLLTIIFLKADSKSIRYFFPLIMTWEVFFFVWLLHLVEVRGKDVELLGGTNKSELIMKLNFRSQCLLISVCASTAVFLLLLV